MAEIPDSDSPGRYASSPLPNFPAAALAPYEGLPSDASSMLEDTEEEEEDDGDTSIDEDDLDDEEVADYDYDLDDEGTEEEVDGEGEDEDGDGDEQDDYYDRDFDLDDFDMRDVDVDFDFEGFGFPADEERLFVDDYLDFPHEDQFGALHHALLHQLEHHLAQEHWGLRPPHSPNMDQPHAGAAARPRTQRDQLVQVEVAGQGNGGGADAPGGQRRHQRQLPPDVIDLTGDDDPEMPPRPNQAARAVPQRQSENQRRLRSQPQNPPPRLNRSDGNYVDDQQVIVLVSSDDEDQPMRASPRRNANHHHHHHHYHNHNHNHNHHHLNRHNDNSAAGRAARNARFGDQPRQPGPASAPAPAPAPAPAQAQHLNNHNSNNSHSNLLSSRLRPFTQLVQNLPLFQFLSNPPAIMANRNHNPDDDIVITGERNVANLANIGPFAGPAQQFIGLGPIHLDYAAHPFPAMQPHAPPAAGAGAGAGPPKPAHEPPKPARPGFTRDTGEDVVAICPSCDQELAYDPEGDDDAPATPAKKPRSKKAMAEHHFWAVKACGHVYCKRCFENRRPPSRSNIQVGFRPDDPPSKKLFCAVEDCDSEVGAKTAWVGIFM
ncbi:hypothetical protein EKO27_g4900 [Xylaria grammica]|uniref:Cell cycle control protein n=1 Tax=Xylaria grammica TaxID=363999 RepID=A0A439D745_9PEZI|nr:hypothetical protein EKO27_g4900 [Xylaria grammica]